MHLKGLEREDEPAYILDARGCHPLPGVIKKGLVYMFGVLDICFLLDDENQSKSKRDTQRKVSSAAAPLIFAAIIPSH